MGLAGPRKKVKLSHDPNNTKWTNDTTSFGHKIMTSQGWTPGQYLGAADAPHAEFHTAANASHIRVMLKDDNLGIGAKRGSGLGEGECTGLDVFQSLLGRLNGKDEDELEKEKRSREELKRAIYTERRWGSIRFVKGGLLVGDKIEKLIEDEAERVRELGIGDKKEAAVAVESDESASSSEADAPVKEKHSKKSKKDKKNKSPTEEKVEESSASDRKSKKEKKKRKAAEAETDDAVEPLAFEKAEKKKSKKSSDLSDADTQKALDKAARKAARKEEKAKRKAAGTIEDDEASASESTSKKSKRDKKRKEKGVTAIDLPTPTIATPLSSTPNSQPGTPNSMLSGRHAVRSRNIMQKRMAVMDQAALNQIFMLKS